MPADTIVNSKATTDTKFGGDALNNVNKYLNGINVTSIIGTPIIRTPTKIPSDILQFTDPQEDNTVTVKIPSLSTDKNINLIPTNVDNNDEVLYRTTVQEVEGKVLSAGTNTISGLTNDNLSGAAGITDANLAQITNAAKLPANTVYTDAAQILTNKELTAPKIATITNGVATLTLPGSTQVMVGRGTVDAMTNKTLDTITSTLKNIGAFKYSIFKDGSTYYCRNNLSGAIEVSNASPNTVLQFPLTNGGSVFVEDGDYTLTSGPTTYFDFPVESIYCHYFMGPQANIIVPQGYTGNVFRLRNTTSNHCTGNTLYGGFIKEGGTPQRLWTAILIEATGADPAFKGIFSNTIEKTRIWDAATGIKLNNDSICTGGFITSNWIQNMFIYRCTNAFIEFGMDTDYIIGVNGIHRNRFLNLTLQSSTVTENAPVVGVKNIRHRENKFDGVYVVDFKTLNGPRSTVHASATDTEIIGGTMDNAVTQIIETVPTVIPWVDDSTAKTTTRITETAGLAIKRITPGDSGTNINIVPTGASNTTSWYNSTQTERFYFQKNGTTDYRFVFNRAAAGGSLRPVSFRQVDTTGATDVESFKIETDASLLVNTNKLKLRDSNDSHNITITVPDIAADYNLAIPTMSADSALVSFPTGSGASQDILVRNASNKYEPLSKGTNNRFLGINSSGDVAYNFVTNANILPHTSTQITITDKTHLNSQIGYKDENSWITSAMITDDSIVNADINASAAIADSKLAQITNKAKLPNDILYGSGKKWGRNQCVHGLTPVWGGILGNTSLVTGLTASTDVVGMTSGQIVAADGRFVKWLTKTSTPTAGDNGGWRLANAATCRAWNPTFFTRFRLNQTADTRLLLGIYNDFTAELNGDDALNAKSGVLFGIGVVNNTVGAGSTVGWQVIHNDGSGASVVDTHSTGIAVDTNIHTIEIVADDANSKFKYSFDGAAYIDIPTEIPATGTALSFTCQIETSAAAQKSMDLFDIFVTSDK